MEALYTASATAHGGRNGTVESSDGILDLDLTMPKEMGGPGDEGATNPEQLFAAGYSACFENALRRVADRQKKSLGEDTSVTANVGIGRDGNGFGLKVELVGHLPGLARGGGGADARRARGLPVLQSHPGQHRSRTVGGGVAGEESIGLGKEQPSSGRR
jgi:osmotically inducible protein OsmC